VVLTPEFQSLIEAQDQSRYEEMSLYLPLEGLLEIEASLEDCTEQAIDEERK
jgi:hypothetical protein